MVTPANIWHSVQRSGPPSSSLFSAPDEKSYITGLVHVWQEPGDGHVADGLLEEHLLYGGRADGAERRQEQEQLPEAAGLGRVPETHHVGSEPASSPHSPGLCSLTGAAGSN